MDLGLKDKVVIVIRARSQIGFGKSIALALAKDYRSSAKWHSVRAKD